MYGYVVPLKAELDCSEFNFYRSFYCGLCKQTGFSYGQLPRFTTNYDTTFLSVLLYEFSGAECAFERKGCVLNPFKKKNSVLKGGLLEKIAAANIILAYYKAVDGVTDKEGLKYRMLRSVLKRPYMKAKALVPTVDESVKTWYDKLRVLESGNCSSPDRAADCFANILKDVAAALLEFPPEDSRNERQRKLLTLSYSVGKFVYLADALDDADGDYKKRRYNPFLAAYGATPLKKKRLDRAGFIFQNRESLEFIISAAVNRAIECFNGIADGFGSCGRELLRNILYRGLREKCEELLNSKEKLKNPRI